MAELQAELQLQSELQAELQLYCCTVVAKLFIFWGEGVGKGEPGSGQLHFPNWPESI